MKNIIWLDMAKGIGILLVMAAHLHHFNYIYSFHLPLFFILSGYTHKSLGIGIGQFISKKINSLIVPYFSLGMILVLFTLFSAFITTKSLELTDVIEVLKQFIIQERMWTLWFLSCLFILNVYFHLLISITKDNEIKLILSAIILSFIIYLYYLNGGTPWPWNADASVMALPFYLTGYLLKKHPKIEWYLLKNKIKSFAIALSLLVIQLITLKINLYETGKTLEMWESSYAILPITIICAIAGSLLFIYISHSFSSKMLVFIGRNSIIYFALHQTIIYPSFRS